MEETSISKHETVKTVKPTF